MSLQRICLLGFGEVGRTLAEDLLLNTQAQLQLWDRQFGIADSPPERNFRSFNGNPRVTRAACATSAAENCALVLSAVTAGEAQDAAQSILPGLLAGTWFVDVNSVSPGTKKDLARTLESAAGRFVEAAIMSPIHPQRSASPMLIAGPFAEDFEALAPALGFQNMTSVSTSYGVAAATKMCRSVVVKGVEALVTESLLTARHYGVDDKVLASLSNLFPRSDWPEHAQYLISRSLEHGVRRAEEMREVAKTVSEASLTPWMSKACAERQEHTAQFASVLRDNGSEAGASGQIALGKLLDAIRQQLD